MLEKKEIPHCFRNLTALTMSYIIHYILLMGEGLNSNFRKWVNIYELTEKQKPYKQLCIVLCKLTLSHMYKHFNFNTWAANDFWIHCDNIKSNFPCCHNIFNSFKNCPFINRDFPHFGLDICLKSSAADLLYVGNV